MSLTGNRRYRSGWGGKLILQLEYSYRYMPAYVRPNPAHIATETRWRDATIDDLLDGAVTPQPPVRIQLPGSDANG